MATPGWVSQVRFAGRQTRCEKPIEGGTIGDRYDVSRRIIHGFTSPYPT
jgi:hypothetical protein